MQQLDYCAVFPGQGSQSVGMLSVLAARYPIVEETFHEGSEVLQFDLWRLVSDGPEEALNETINTQPALLAAGVACWRCWKEEVTQQAVFVAGHSLGEYTALVAAGVLSYPAAIKLVSTRAKLMQQAVPKGEGGMAAILGLSAEDLRAICSESSQHASVVSQANINAPGQIVIAGHKNALDKAIALAKTAGAKRALILPVSVPSHCALMQTAADKFAEEIHAIPMTTATIPVIQNVDATARIDAVGIKKALIAQLCQPVLWVDSVLCMQQAGNRHIVECGPGKVLSGLNKRIDRQLILSQTGDPDALAKALTNLSIQA